MSTDASAGAGELDTGDDYQAMLDTLDTAIEEARRKVESGRVYDAENERTRIKWVRALAYAVDTRRKVKADQDLEELTDRVAELERRQGRDP